MVITLPILFYNTTDIQPSIDMFRIFFIYSAVEKDCVKSASLYLSRHLTLRS